MISYSDKASHIRIHYPFASESPNNHMKNNNLRVYNNTSHRPHQEHVIAYSCCIIRKFQRTIPETIEEVEFQTPPLRSVFHSLEVGFELLIFSSRKGHGSLGVPLPGLNPVMDSGTNFSAINGDTKQNRHRAFCIDFAPVDHIQEPE